MPITFDAKLVRIEVYMTLVNLTIVTFIQGHKCVLKLD